MIPVEPKPAASVILVRAASAAGAEPLEAYLVRRQQRMKFLGGYYAFPGGKVDAVDAETPSLTRCRGLAAAAADLLLAGGAVPALAYWVTAIRELLEECGLLLACDEDGAPIDGGRPEVAAAVEEVRQALMRGGTSLPALLDRHGWYLDCAALRYLSHFITPVRSPIRFSARFFLCPLPVGQAPRLFTEETSEGFWIGPGEGVRRFRAGEMAMAEPAEYGLGYLAQFASLEVLWAAHADGRHKFHGIIDRIDAFWEGFDWITGRWPGR